MSSGAPLELSVRIGGAPLRTHALGPGNFVVAQPGVTFEVSLKNVGQLRTSVEVELDGSYVGQRFVMQTGNSKIVKGFRLPGGTQVQQFVFAYPPTFEGSTSAPLPGTSAALGALGSITATCYHVVPLRGPVSRPPTGIRHVEQKAVPEGKKALALGVTVAGGATINEPFKGASWKADKSRPPICKVELRYCVPDALKLSNDPALKAAADALIAAGPDPAAGAAAAGAASSSSAAAAGPSAPLNAAASGNAPASADVKPERKRRGKAKASSEVVELSDDDAPPKLPKVEAPPSNTADAPIDLT